MTDSNFTNERKVFPLDALLVGDVFSIIGSPSIFCRMMAKSDTQIIVQYLTGASAGEYTQAIPTIHVVKESVH